MSVMLLERGTLVPAVLPADYNGQANDGDWISLKNYARVAVVYFSGDGTAASDPTLTIEQATDVAGAGAKGLNFTTIYRKQAASALTATGQFTKTTQTAASTYTEGTSGESVLLWVVEFRSDELDVPNNFDCIRARVASVGAAKIGAILYVLGEARHPSSPETMLSAIVD